MNRTSEALEAMQPTGAPPLRCYGMNALSHEADIANSFSNQLLRGDPHGTRSVRYAVLRNAVANDQRKTTNFRNSFYVFRII
jgi:hypothetical protein